MTGKSFTRLSRIFASALLAAGLAATCAAASRGDSGVGGTALAGHSSVSRTASTTAAGPAAKPAATDTVGSAAGQSAAIVRAGGVHRVGVQPAATAPSGFDPADLRGAYNLASAAASGGKGATVAIVDVGDDPTAAADLAVYRAQYGLPACTAAAGCLRKVNEEGQTSPLPPDEDYAPAWSMDMDMVSAICPSCRILLVDASSTEDLDMGKAVDSAVSLGAKYVIVGWTAYYGPTPVTDAEFFNHPGVAITVPAGDSGFHPSQNDDQYPATSPYVTSVGGTTLERASNARGWTETVWGPTPTDDASTASGCNLEYGRPSWEVGSGCAGRNHNDVAAVANPATGVAYYSTDPKNGEGWSVGGGTSVSASIVGAVYALAGPPAADSYPASYPYLDTAALYPVTSGSNVLAGSTCSPVYLCTAGSGYNGPAGLGTPDGTGAFTAPAADTVGLVGFEEQYAYTLPAPVSLQMAAEDTAGNPLTFTATGLPPGVSVNPATGLLSGAVTRDFDGTTTVTATDSTGATATASVSWDESNRFSLGYPSTTQTEPDTAVSLQMPYTEPDKDATISFSATGLPPGLTIDPATGLISGTTGSSIASYQVTVSATDSTGTSSTRSFTWNVWNKITLTTPTFEQSFVGEPVDVPVATADSAPGATVTVSAENLPAGLSFDPATGVISGAPTALANQLVTLNATDGTESAGTVTIGWAVGGVITLGRVAPQTTTVGQPVNLSFAFGDNAAGDYIGYGSDGLPPGLGPNGVAPEISGTATTTGTYQVTITGYGRDGGVGTTSFTWTVLPAPDAGPTGPVRMGAGGKCLDDTGNGSANGTKIQAWACNDGPSQSWTYAEDGTLRIHGKCLAAAGTASGSGIIVTTCTGTATQRWDMNGGAWLLNQVSGFCLRDPDGTAKKNGVQLEAADCSPTEYATQTWVLPAGPILSAIAGKCLDDYQGSTQAGAEVDLASCTGSSRQNWTYEPAGTIEIFGLCLTRDTADGIQGSNVTLQKCDGTESQQWNPVAGPTFLDQLQAPGGELGPPGNIIERPELVRLISLPAAYYWHIW